MGGGFPAGTLNVGTVDFIDGQTGFATGATAAGAVRLYTTTDGGSTWTSVSSERISQVSFRDGLTGGAVGPYGDRLWITRDGGVTWTDEAVPFRGPAPGAQIAYVNAVQARPDGWVIGGSNNRIVVALDDAATGVAGAAAEDAPPAVPGAVRLLGARPNPCNPSTVLRFELNAGGSVRLTVHDLTGRRVRLLENGRFEAGRHEARWDGRDDAGRPVASGVYLARIVAKGVADSARLVLIR